MTKPLDLTDSDLRRIRTAVETGDETFDAISARFGFGRRRLRTLIAKYGWHSTLQVRQSKSEHQRKTLHKARPNSYLANPAKYIATKRAEVEAIERKIYGNLLSDVQWLRHRGWVITAERGAYRVGNAVVDAAVLAAKAARERRLAGVAA